jgi:hypothetical protein
MALLGTLIGIMIVGFIVGAPSTILLMLFLGNLEQIDPSPGFWDCFPGGVILGLVISSPGKRG